MMPLGVLPAFADGRQFVLWDGDPARGFLLKHVEHVDHADELDRVHRAIGLAIKVIDDLNEASECSREALRGAVVPAALRLVQREAEDPTGILGERAQVLAARAHPFDRFKRCGVGEGHGEICLIRHVGARRRRGEVRGPLQGRSTEASAARAELWLFAAAQVCITSLCTGR